jgi:alpha-L-rhamnosidase
MNSFNHYAYGAIGEWLYSYVAGIRLDEKNPGYKHFFLNPHPGGGLTHANAEFNSIYGKIISACKTQNNSLEYSCTIPPNTTATIIFDDTDAAGVSINNQPLSFFSMLNTTAGNGKLKIEVGSGTYNFTIRLKGVNH